jgi:hypothetical protein
MGEENVGRNITITYILWAAKMYCTIVKKVIGYVIQISAMKAVL